MYPYIITIIIARVNILGLLLFITQFDSISYLEFSAFKKIGYPYVRNRIGNWNKSVSTIKMQVLTRAYDLEINLFSINKQ